MKTRRFLALLAVISIVLTFSGCKRNTDDDNVETATVRFLNFKPESAAIYQKIAEAYKKETGRTIIVETAANNTYEQTLSAKISTTEAPTIFQINGPRGYANWKRYCADLKDTELYKHLTDKTLAITANDEVYGIPYVVEGYGIIYNDAVMKRYFALNDRKTTFQSMDEIDNFNDLKSLAEDLQANKAALGIKGAFASTSLKPGEDWRWQTHLANIPIYYEFRDKNIDLSSDATKSIDFRHADKFRNIFDLYLKNSTVDSKTLGTKIVDESMTEFALGECAMVQNGNWAWNQIKSVKGNTVTADNIKYLPIYTGMSGEEKQGLCIGTESYFCINNKATESQQQAAAEFLYWLFSSKNGKAYVTDELGFIAPFDTFDKTERPADPLAKEIIRYMENSDTVTIPWNFTLFPGQKFKDDFGAALLQYAQGRKTWDDVKSTVITRWKAESALL